MGINLDYNSIGFGAFAMDSFTASYASVSSLNRIFFLAEFGAGLEYVFSNGFKIASQSAYLMGFNKLIRLDVEYQHGSQPVQTAQLHSRGQYIKFGLAISYCIAELTSNESSNPPNQFR
jgi:hypothetical protein